MDLGPNDALYSTVSMAATEYWSVEEQRWLKIWEEENDV